MSCVVVTRIFTQFDLGRRVKRWHHLKSLWGKRKEKHNVPYKRQSNVSSPQKHVLHWRIGSFLSSDPLARLFVKIRTGSPYKEKPTAEFLFFYLLGIHSAYLHHTQVYRCAAWTWVLFCSLESYLEWIKVSAFSASVNQESVKASISARNCNQASLLAGPSRPETQGNNVWVGLAIRIPLKFIKMWPPSNIRRHSQKRPHKESAHMRTQISTLPFLLSETVHAALLVGDYLLRYFCRWCRFLLLVCSGRPVFSSSPRLPERLSPDTGWHS